MKPSRPAALHRLSPTQPLGWDWVRDLKELDSSLRALEQRHCWNWRRDLDTLERDLDTLATD